MTARYRTCLAIKTNGTLWGWGDNNLGQLGLGTTTDTFTPQPVGSSANWRSIYNNSRLTFGIKTDNTLWGWGTQANPNSFLGINGLLVPTVQIGTATDWLTLSIKPYGVSEYLLLLKTIIHCGHGAVMLLSNSGTDRLTVIIPRRPKPTR